MSWETRREIGNVDGIGIVDRSEERKKYNVIEINLWCENSQDSQASLSLFTQKFQAYHHRHSTVDLIALLFLLTFPSYL